MQGKQGQARISACWILLPSEDLSSLHCSCRVPRHWELSAVLSLDMHASERILHCFILIHRTMITHSSKCYCFPFYTIILMSNVQITKTEWVSSFCLGRKASITILSDSVNSQGPQEKQAILPGMNLDKLYSLEWGRTFLPTTKPRLVGPIWVASAPICTEDLPPCEREKEEERGWMRQRTEKERKQHTM